MRVLLLGLGLMLCLNGCALPPALTIASFAADGVSYVATGKSTTDHALSAIAQEDCAMMRALAEKAICAPARKAPIEAATPKPKAKHPMRAGAPPPPKSKPLAKKTPAVRVAERPRRRDVRRAAPPLASGPIAVGICAETSGMRPAAQCRLGPGA